MYFCGGDSMEKPKFFADVLIRCLVYKFFAKKYQKKIYNFEDSEV